MDESELSRSEAAIVAAGIDVRDGARRLSEGELPAQLEAEYLRKLSLEAARIAVAQAIDRACAASASRFAVREDTTSQPSAHPFLNTNLEHGLVLPVSTIDGMIESDVDDRPEGLRGFFMNLLFIPAWVRAAHPDDEDRTSDRVRLRYVRASLADVPNFDSDLPVAIGYVPLNEAEDDLGFDFRTRGARACYSAQPEPAARRLLQALERLSGQGAQLIVVPETALQTSDLLQVRQGLAAIGDAPGCRLIAVLIGIASPAGPDGERARNEVVVLGRDGAEIARQQKLTHWNLTPDQQRRYDLRGGAAAGEDLYEDTDPGDALTIVELPHVGRLAIHICADLQAKEPANWVRRNMTLDWSITPLMDSTLTYDLNKWSFRRALEAARSGRTQAVVAASLILTQRQNRVNQAAGAMHRYTALCGLLLLLDGRFGEVQGVLAEERLRTPSPEAIANLVLHPGKRPLVRSCKVDLTGQHAHRSCLVVEGDDLYLVRSARLVRPASHLPASPESIDCDVEAGSGPDTLHFVYDLPKGVVVDGMWDVHLIGRPSTASDGQTITTFNAQRLPFTT